MRLVNWLQSTVLACLCASAASAQDATTYQPTSVTTSSSSSGASATASAAAKYATYQGDVAELGAKPFSSTSEIDQKLDDIGGQNYKQLSAGWMSYSALIAAQNREFASSINDMVGHYGRERMIRAFETNPGYVISLKGGDRAVQAALAASKDDASRMRTVANYMESQQASLQKQSWINQRIRDGQARAQKLVSLSYTGRPVSSAAQQLFSGPDVSALLASAGAGDTSQIWERAGRIASNAPRSAISSFSSRSYSVNPNYQTTVDHMASLAAYEVLDEATTSQAGVRNALSDVGAERNFESLGLQLQGCVGSQSDHYGLQACLREHAVSDVAKNVDNVAR